MSTLRPFLIATLLVLTSLLVYASWVVLTTPSPTAIKGCLTTKKHSVRLCPGTAGYVALKNISPYLRHLILIAEDAAFYSHDGFDWSELEQSVMRNISSGRFARGGSTITQQLAKNVFLDFDKSLARKLREAILARDIEKILSKDQILERYLNVIEFGPNVFGVKAAAQYYFKKTPTSLNLLESAFLTYLVPNPKVHAKVFKDGQLSTYARYRLLDLCYRMLRFQRISSLQYETAKELVDAFPWTALTGNEVAALNGEVGEPFDIESLAEVSPVQDLPEEDQSLVPVEPPEESAEDEPPPQEDDSEPFD